MLVMTAGGVACRFSEVSSSTTLVIHTFGASRPSRITMFPRRIRRDLRGTDRAERCARSKFAERSEPA